MSRSPARFPVRVVVVLLSGESLPDASRCVLSVVVHRVERGPSAGLVALPSAFHEAEERLEETVKRALSQVGVRRTRELHQIGTTVQDGTVTVTYLAAVDRLPQGSARDGSIELLPIRELAGRRRGNISMHESDSKAVEAALQVFRQQIENTSLALSVVPEVFTLGQLRSIYEDAWGKKLDPRNFRRKLLDGPLPAIMPTGDSLRERGTRGRPPELFRATRHWGVGVPITGPLRQRANKAGGSRSA